ncbi:MAG: cytochrome d ubiquinol oxidase subunit II [Neisseria sp.]|nr:cytochrome d ubiquinol oxidase subunit II [Neisseria sp.]
MDWHTILSYLFLGLLGFSVSMYAVLDGFDLGVGMLMPRAKKEEHNTMIGSIGPFWDANETWLVLAVGVLFIVFPSAHALILGELYLPVTLMLLAIMIRGVAFDFRVKARPQHQPLWNFVFQAASGGMALSQGYMLGRYVTGFQDSFIDHLFAIGIALSVPAVYVLLGATWLLVKTEGELQEKARQWANQAWYPVVLCLVLVSLATPYVSSTVFTRWFSMPNILFLLPIPLITAFALWRVRALLLSERIKTEKMWQPFALTALSLVLSAIGLGISLFPYVVIDTMLVTDAAASTPTLVVTLIGVALTVPMILAYTIFAYWVFRGKAKHLVYG